MKYCYLVNNTCSCSDFPREGTVCFKNIGASGGGSGNGAAFAENIVNSGATFVADNLSVFAVVGAAFAISKVFRSK
jgi:hypothetical protein